MQKTCNLIFIPLDNVIEMPDGTPAPDPASLAERHDLTGRVPCRVQGAVGGCAAQHQAAGKFIEAQREG